MLLSVPSAFSGDQLAGGGVGTGRGSVREKSSSLGIVDIWS